MRNVVFDTHGLKSILFPVWEKGSSKHTSNSSAVKEFINIYKYPKSGPLYRTEKVDQSKQLVLIENSLSQIPANQIG